MNDKFIFYICSNYKMEIEKILTEEDFGDVTCSFFPSTCGRPPLKLKQIIKPELTETSAFNCIMGGICIKNNHETAAETQDRSGLSVRVADNCFYQFLNKEIVDSLIRAGSYLITPGWLKSWQYQIKTKLGFDQETARKFFRESIKKLVLLDTGVDPGSSRNLREMAEFLDMPFEAFPVGLDFFRLILQKRVLEFRLSKEKEKGESFQAKTNRQFADYAMILHFMNKLHPRNLLL